MVPAWSTAPLKRSALRETPRETPREPDVDNAFPLGRRVQIHGLLGKPEYNNLYGYVVGSKPRQPGEIVADTAEQRWTVRIYPYNDGYFKKANLVADTVPFDKIGKLYVSNLGNNLSDVLLPAHKTCERQRTVEPRCPLNSPSVLMLTLPLRVPAQSPLRTRNHGASATTVFWGGNRTPCCPHPRHVSGKGRSNRDVL